MSGGVAWVLDEDGRFAERCNADGLDLEPLDDNAAREARELLDRHREATGSRRAWRITNDWKKYRERFVQVMPREYRRALAELEVRRG
jgi:glutamate synthase domain-containing protein 3